MSTSVCMLTCDALIVLIRQVQVLETLLWFSRVHPLHLEALLHLTGQPHPGPRVGSQVHDRDVVLQRILCGGAECGILFGPKGARVVCDVIRNRHNLCHTCCSA